MIKINFTRQFVSGHLTGLTHDDSITFPSFDLANRWIEAIAYKSSTGKLDYKVTNYKVTRQYRYKLLNLSGRGQRRVEEVVYASSFAEAYQHAYDNYLGKAGNRYEFLNMVVMSDAGEWEPAEYPV